MTFKDFKELKSLEDKGLTKELINAMSFLAASKFENKQGQFKDTSQLKKLRRHIARIKTLKHMRTFEKQAASKKS